MRLGHSRCRLSHLISHVLPDGSLLVKVLTHAAGRLHSGNWHSTEALLAGADTWYSVAAGVFPEVCLSVATPASCSPRIAMICSSVNSTASSVRPSAGPDSGHP